MLKVLTAFEHMQLTNVESQSISSHQESAPVLTASSKTNTPQAPLFNWRPTDEKRLAESEAVMLRRISYHQDVVAGLNTVASVPIRFDGASRPSRTKEIMVLIHGFAGGLACWAQNWDYFADHYELYAIDLPGFARSERKSVKINSLEDSISYICGYIERWFEEMDFGCPVIIVGHSFGGFIAAQFAMRGGANRVRLLALADPWGVDEADPEHFKQAPARVRFGVKVLQRMNPLAGLRAMGPMGPVLFRLIRPDFSNRWKNYLDDPKAFYDYTYHCNAQLPPLGEKLFEACRDAHVSAKEPLCTTLPVSLSKDIPLVMLYGSHTWINAERGFTMASDMTAMGFSVIADTVMNAGHQVFTDNVTDFNRQMFQAINEMLSAKCVTA